MNTKLTGVLALGIALVFSGCATNLSKPSKPIGPTSVRLGTFDKVEMKAVSISERFAENSANQKALKKIDEFVSRDMQIVFPGLKRIETNEEFSPKGEKILQIVPEIKEIKFVGGGARFWAGAMAGSSAVLMQVTYIDGSTGETIGDPEFYRSAGAYAGAWTIGSTDNRMLEDIARDVTDYSMRSK